MSVAESMRAIGWTDCPACGYWGGIHASTCTATYTPQEILENLGANYSGLRDRAERARKDLHNAIRDAAAAGVPEAHIARFSGVDRMTVRKALGKKR